MHSRRTVHERPSWPLKKSSRGTTLTCSPTARLFEGEQIHDRLCAIVATTFQAFVDVDRPSGRPMAESKSVLPTDDELQAAEK